MLPLNYPAKRRRGGQPGNQNAKGNRGNPNPRPNYGNRGGRGAPRGNQNARKRPSPPHEILLQQYRDDQEAAEWIKAHSAELCDPSFTDDDHRDRALYDGFCGITPEYLAEKRKEYRLRLFVTIENDCCEDEGQTD
jgi:hypothetical protein